MKLLTHSLRLIDFFDLHSILSDISIATPHFYYHHGIFFSTLSIFLCLNLKCVFCRWLVVGSCVCIHSANLRLLIRQLNSFKVLLLSRDYGIAVGHD